MIEFGSGSSTKTPILLRAVAAGRLCADRHQRRFPARKRRRRCSGEFPDLPIYPVEADFTRPFALPAEVAGAAKLGFFPGSTIGNFVARSAVDLLRAMKETLGEGARLVIGMDRIKDVDILVRAYDDAGRGDRGVQPQPAPPDQRASSDGDIPVDAFRHRAIWNDALSRIEMHLEAVRDIAFTICGRRFAFRAGETIHTENSHKYGHRDSRILLRAAGWGVVAEWTDERRMVLDPARRGRAAPLRALNRALRGRLPLCGAAATAGASRLCRSDHAAVPCSRSSTCCCRC